MKTATLRLLLALSCLLVAGGCTEDPLEQGPFPCAGDGTCPDSLTCTLDTTSGAVGMCTRGCSSSSECEEGSRCAEVGDTAACLAECDLFGTDCEGMTSCRVQPLAEEAGFFATCVAFAAGHKLGDECEAAIDCPPGASCFRASPDQPFTCRAHCDAEHSCRHHMTCEPLVASGAGVCL